MSSTTTISIAQHEVPAAHIEHTKDVAPYSLSRPRSLPDDIEMNSLPSQSFSHNGVGRTLSRNLQEEPPASSSEQVHTIWNPYKNRFRVLAACFTSFANGMNDSAPGALIASIEREYNIKYGTVALIFVCNALGFIAAAFFLSSLSKKIGRAKVMMSSEMLLMIGYGMIIPTPPFPVITLAFFILGIGMGMNLAICQVFCANLANNTAMVGMYQGAYGMGGISGPLIATALISRGTIWSHFYIVELGLASLNFCFAPWAFWGVDQDSAAQLPQPATEAAQTSRNTDNEVKRKLQSFKKLANHKPTTLGALFCFAYQGAEVAISGWVISFLVQFRHGDPSKVGFVTSGFWAGITFGRFTLSFLAHQAGERRFVFFVVVGASILELLIWFVPSIPGDSVAVAFSGLLLGPIHPCMIHILQKLIPRDMQISSLSVIGSVGSSGGALAPFMTGMLAQKSGTFVLHPICIGLFMSMMLTWWLLPRPERRDD